MCTTNLATGECSLSKCVCVCLCLRVRLGGVLEVLGASWRRLGACWRRQGASGARLEVSGEGFRDLPTPPRGRQGGRMGGQGATEAADSALVCSLNSWYSCRVLYNSLDSWYSCRVLYNASKAGGCLTDPESVARSLPLWSPLVVSPLVVSPCGLVVSPCGLLTGS